MASGLKVTPAAGFDDQAHAVIGPFVALPFKPTVPPGQIVSVVGVMVATGFAAAGTVRVISSTAIEGSAPSSFATFTHRNPILTPGLLFAEAGKLTLLAVHKP